MPSLYIVATPIGNLQDITLRALEVLRATDLIVCEDTRHSRKLLTAYDIHKPLLSGHAHNEAATAERLVRELAAGQEVAYVTDAGTPGVSDPGNAIVRRVRAAGYPVIPVPGPSALAAILSVSGFPGRSVTFDGFLSPKGSRRRARLGILLSQGHSFVLYESPFRVVKLLEDLVELAPRRRLLLGREMTKIHEEYLEGSADELLRTLGSRGTQKGEFVLQVGPDDIADGRGDVSAPSGGPFENSNPRGDAGG